MMQRIAWVCQQKLSYMLNLKNLTAKTNLFSSANNSDILKKLYINWWGFTQIDRFTNMNWVI